MTTIKTATLETLKRFPRRRRHRDRLPPPADRIAGARTRRSAGVRAGAGDLPGGSRPRVRPRRRQACHGSASALQPGARQRAREGQRARRQRDLPAGDADARHAVQRGAARRRHDRAHHRPRRPLQRRRRVPHPSAYTGGGPAERRLLPVQPERRAPRGRVDVPLRRGACALGRGNRIDPRVAPVAAGAGRHHGAAGHGALRRPHRRVRWRGRDGGIADGKVATGGRRQPRRGGFSRRR